MNVVTIHAHRQVSYEKPASGDRLREASHAVPRTDKGGDGVRGDDENTRFATVVLPHLGEAYALARWLTGNRTDAEDVVQDACLRAFRGIGGFTGVNSRAWLLTIVRHAAYTWLGKNRPAALVMTDDLEAAERK